MSGSWTHTTPGTTARAWAAAPQWAHVADLRLVDADGAPVTRLVVAAAHPDDESLGAAGLVLRAARDGLRVDVVIATAGEGSHPASPTHPPDAMARRRREESRRAVDEVAPGAGLLHLERPDGRLADDPAGLAAALVEVVGDGRGVLLVGPWRDDGHPDHDALGRACAVAAARAGCRSLGYPVWSWHWRTAGDLPWSRLRRWHLDAADRAAKQRAIAAHASQVLPLSDRPGDEAVLPPEVLAHFAGDEVFVEQEPGDDALEVLHRDHDEPWQTEDRWYEQRKRALLLAALPRAHYRRGWEVGCSTGVLTTALADRCDDVVGTDTSASALQRARDRTASLPAVRLLERDAVTPWDADLPPGGFDLVVLSEVGYFLSPQGLERLADSLAVTAPDADVVLCHWRHEVVGWPLDGPAVHAALRHRLTARGLAELGCYRDRDVEILVLGPPDSRPEPER